MAPPADERHVPRQPAAFQTLNTWKEQVLGLGFATHDDSIAYAHKAIKTVPFLAGVIRERFPLLFVDEAQDTSDAQAEIGPPVARRPPC